MNRENITALQVGQSYSFEIDRSGRPSRSYLDTWNFGVALLGMSRTIEEHVKLATNHIRRLRDEFFPTDQNPTRPEYSIDVQTRTSLCGHNGLQMRTIITVARIA